MKPMINPSLTTYINKLREMKVSDEKIKEQLIKSGWQNNEVEEALGPVSKTSDEILPPPPVPRYSMWISFQYVLLFITLWIWSIALGSIWNYAIDKHIPDNVAKTLGYDYMNVLRGTLLQGYMAAILVAYPFFLILFFSLDKHVEENPGIRNIKTRKILMYGTIIVNFLYMISMLISSVFGYLGATTSTRTIPHLLVNLIIPGSICWFLLQAVREDRKTIV